MNSTDEILFLVIGIIAGIVAGGLAGFLLFGRKSANQNDDQAKQQYEKDIIRLETSLAHSNREIEEKKRTGIERERVLAEITRKFNESSTNLSVAEERNQNLSSDYTKLAEKAARQETELSAARENLAQISANAQVLENTVADKIKANNLKEIEIHDLTVQVQNLFSENATLTANLTSNEGKLAVHKAEIEDIREKSHLEFESIANRLLESKSEKFTETNRANIENILLPLSKEISSFKTKVEETYEKESQQRFSLEKEVKALIEQTDKVSSEANNLATALKGQAKKQGDWGEMILERILETNGLVRHSGI